MDKRKSLENKLYKLLKNRPYNVVRAECDRIGRQIMELDKRTVKAEDKEGNIEKSLLYQFSVDTASE